MKFAVSKKGETSVDLVRRLYSCASKSDLELLSKRLLEANPTLKDPAKLPDETLVIVPEVEGFETSAAAVTQADVAHSVVARLRKQIGDLGEVLAVPAARQDEREKAILAIANSSEVRKLVDREPDLQERIAKVAQHAVERADRVKKLRELQNKVAGEFESDLDAMLDLFAPRTGLGAEGRK